MTHERRNHPRLKVRVPVELRGEANEAPIRAETADLSLGGFYVEMLFTLKIGTRLDISLQVGESTLLAMGEVITCDRTVGNGIRFTRMLTEDHEELARFLQGVRDSQFENQRMEPTDTRTALFDLSDFNAEAVALV